MANGDIIPPTDLTTAAIEAVNLILSELGISPLDELLSLFSGKPKFEDTDNVINAYNQSAYWPLHALASDLAIAAKNGAPISDSRAAIQAQFGVWKQGTVTSIQSLAHETPGQNSPGYWTIFALINHSWGASGSGQPAVLQYVKALDALTQVLSEQATKPPPPPKPPPPITGGGGGQIQPPPPPPPPPNANPCQSSDPNSDEILDLCAALQAALANLPQPIQPTGDNGACCAAVVQAIASVVGQLTIIAQAIVNPPTTPNPLDLTPITTALQELVTAAMAFPATETAIGDLLATGLGNIANAITSSGGTDLTIIDRFVKWVQSEFQMQPGELLSWVNAGLVPSDVAQLYSGTIRPPIHNATTLEYLRIFFGDVDLFSNWVNSHFKSWLANTLPAWLDHFVSFALKYLQTANSSGIINNAQWTQLGQDLLATFETVLGPLGGFALTTLQKNVSAPGDIAPESAEANFKTMIGNASALGAMAWGAATVGGLIFGEHSKHLNYFAALFALGAGYDAVAEGLVKALVDPLVTTPAKYYYKGQFKAEYPNESNAVEWHSRRLDVGRTLEEIFKYSGLKTKYETAYINAAFRPVSPFMIAGGFTNKEVPQAILQDAFQFMGLRDQDVQLAINSVEVRALQAVNQAYVQEAVTGYADGVVGDQELAQILTDAGFGQTAASLVTKRALLARRIKLAQITESFVVPEVTGGLLTAPQGTNALEAAGIQPWLADLKIQLAETRAALNLNRKELAAEAKLNLQRSRAAARTSIADFRNGTINAVGLEAALLAAQQDPLIAGLTVATEQAIQQGRLKFIYGQLLTPEAAKVLDQQVSALASQATHQLIDPTSAQAQLQALNIPQPQVTALIARWFASQTKPTVPETLLPIK